MVLFEGSYSGVFIPERHFIVLKKDFSNFDDVVSKLHDHSFLQALADRTYEEVALDPRWSYRSFIQKVDAALQEEVERSATQRASRTYTKIEFDRATRLSLNWYLRRKIALFMQAILLGTPFARKVLFWLWETLPRPLKQLARPVARIVSR